MLLLLSGCQLFFINNNEIIVFAARNSIIWLESNDFIRFEQLLIRCCCINESLTRIVVQIIIVYNYGNLYREACVVVNVLDC